jgi:hypothetical protein
MPGVIGGVYFLIFLAGIWLVITWCKASDEGSAGEETKGLFAMKDIGAEKTRRSRWKPHRPGGERT